IGSGPLGRRTGRVRTGRAALGEPPSRREAVLARPGPLRDHPDVLGRHRRHPPPHRWGPDQVGAFPPVRRRPRRPAARWWPTGTAVRPPQPATGPVTLHRPACNAAMLMVVGLKTALGRVTAGKTLTIDVTETVLVIRWGAGSRTVRRTTNQPATRIKAHRPRK